MSNEMLPADIFTRARRPGWAGRVTIKHLLTDDDDLMPDQIKGIGQQIAAALKNCHQFRDEEIIANFESVDDLDEFNSILEDMYDYCDNVRIWVA